MAVMRTEQGREAGQRERPCGPTGGSVGNRDKRFWFRCPGCHGMGTVDADQIAGRVSVDCGACSYHETKDWRS